ncbi:MULTISPECIES: amino acid ABC transporter ATP-binding protein [Clostridium]|uniref:Amino acid ABC transporter ATP-binding protein n=1 Tax=Clostridium cadaveris TaxID=1529 RepID=A0A1I2KDJ4_9CLOT|nr:amino acid ABC transporter ATP-binding protein [Clostridium cadaveris]MDU4952140.1 amino acid ABC transporter ATP-binding protein [Clostridium sp.]MDM8313487.1 amino acid ABC transporter ATP-binding protein [Clostridium cadaveris]NME65094.1 amino acid ABC transporter ATP-binding protein [Clostridium cadaveris]NWK12294.1 amino acid ABC transporter ATP-binding protein [Clostridium cadaveris]PWL54904.1 MAG: amino acid ABC transporter ATP-binding protein [Clostridium cadaveris]
MLSITGLKKSFGKDIVLQDINLEVMNGEVTVIVGPSGSGKTTLLRCINVLEKCDGGTIKINNDYICIDGKYADKKQLKEVRREIGLVFQDFNLFPHMSVIENLVEAPQKVLGKTKNETVIQGRTLLELLGLRGKEESYPSELSGGQKQRVAIGRALMMNPSLMCFDEPTSALDPGLVDDVAALIRELAARGMSILIITHDMSFAKKAADNIISIKNGVILKEHIYKLNS